MSKIAFITGITGQDGPYLAKVLLGKGYKVYGMVRNFANANLYGLNYLNINGQVELVFGELNELESVKTALIQTKPDEIYHLASQSSVINSWDNLSLTLKTNADATTVFLEYLKDNPTTKLFLAQSSELFGRDPVNHEKKILEPYSPYGVSKLFSYHLGKIYREKYGLYIVNGIFYIHESPLRNINFFSRKVTQTVAKISAGMADELVLGNIDLYRDIGFVGDYMEAVSLMLVQPTPKDYVLATGKHTLLRDFVRLTFEQAGIMDYQKYIKLNNNFFRKEDPIKVKGWAADTFDALGWNPHTSVEEIIRLMLVNDREFIKNPKNLETQYIIPFFY